MTPRERFLSALLRPLVGTGELGLAAWTQIEKWLDEAGAGSADLDRAAERFERRDARAEKQKWRRFARLALVAAALVSLLAPVVRPATVVIQMNEDLFDIWGVVGSHWFQCSDYFPDFQSSDTTGEGFGVALARGLTPEQALVLRGDPKIQSNAARTGALWRKHFPDDPAAFYDFLRWNLMEHGKLPDGSLETAERLDPENGYVDLLAASIIFKRSHGKVFGSYDKEKLIRGLGLFHRAASKPVCTGRSAEWNRKRTAGFRPTDNYSTFIARYSLRRGEQWKKRDIFTSLERSIRWAAGQLRNTVDAADPVDHEMATQFVDDWLKIMPKLAAIRGDLADIQGTRQVIVESADSLRWMCVALRLKLASASTGKIRHAETSIDRLRGEAHARDRLWVWHGMGDGGSMLAGAGLRDRNALAEVLRQSAGDVKIDSGDLTPGRLADYCDFEWVALRPISLILLFLAGLVLLFWRFMSFPSWFFGRRLAQSLLVADWAWILGLGVVAPLAWHVLATRLPVFRAREISLCREGILVPTTQAAALLLLLLSALIQCSRWRLSRRLRVLGFGTRRFAWGGWLPVTAAALALPAAGLPAFVESPWVPDIASRVVFAGWPPFVWIFMPAAALLTLTLLWLASLFFGVFAGHGDRTPFRAAAAFVFASACVPTVLILLLAASPAAKLEFRHWLARDPVLFVSPEYDGMTKYEFKTAEYLRERTLRSFGE